MQTEQRRSSAHGSGRPERHVGVRDVAGEHGESARIHGEAQRGHGLPVVARPRSSSDAVIG
jgi:hypothetical protein